MDPVSLIVASLAVLGKETTGLVAKDLYQTFKSKLASRFFPRRKRSACSPNTPLVIAEDAHIKANTFYPRSWLWIGRSKLAGRGEAASGLRFDVTEKRKP